MASLGPIGYLVFWLALAAAPPGATMTRVEMGDQPRVELTRDSRGRWMRTLPAEQPVYLSREGTALVMRAAIPTGNPAEDERRLPLHEWFGLTGHEDWTRTVSILVKPATRAGREVTVDGGRDRLEIVATGPGGRPLKTLVTWNARR